MQITRERVRENIVQSMTEVCPYVPGQAASKKIQPDPRNRKMAAKI
jgi:Ribonuclease G/E